MKFTHSGAYLASADKNGVIKYFEPNMNNLTAWQGSSSKEAIRGISFSPDDRRFATASDDSSIRIWSFAESMIESVLTGSWSHCYNCSIIYSPWRSRVGCQVCRMASNKRPPRFWQQGQSNQILGPEDQDCTLNTVGFHIFLSSGMTMNTRLLKTLPQKHYSSISLVAKWKKAGYSLAGQYSKNMGCNI